MPTLRRRPTRSSRALRTTRPRTQNSGSSARFPRLQTATHSHIQIQKAFELKDIDEEDEEPEFIIRNKSLQTEIEEELAGSVAVPSTFNPASRPTTFAEAATMSARRGTRAWGDGEEGGEDDTFDAIAGPVTFESLGPFKYIIKKKKKPAPAIAKSKPSSSGAETGETGSSSSTVEGIKGAGVKAQRVVSADPGVGRFSAERSEDGMRSLSVSRAEAGGSSPNPFPTTTTTTPALRSAIKTTTAAQAEAEAGFGVSSGKDKGKGKEKAFEPVSTPGSIPTIVPPSFSGCLISDPPSAQFPFTPYASTTGQNFHLGKHPSRGISDVSDSASTKGRFEEAMARLTGFIDSDVGSPKPRADNGFDAIDWDPDLPTAAAQQNEPEPLVAKPQPLAYTTVGSLVNPDAVPQFTAPNRIQREGSGRRVQIPQTEHHDNPFHRRRPPPPLNLANSMQYTQQLLARSPGHGQNSNTPPSQGRSSTMSSHPSEQQSYDAFLRLQSLPLPRVRPGNASKIPKHPSTSDSSPSTTELTSQPSHANEPVIPVNKIHKELPGMEKMQTLQRMAKYDNPFQDYARNRLSDFSAAARSQEIGKTVTNPTGRQISFETLMASTHKEAQKAEKGELDRGFQFPPPGIPNPAQYQSSQANPLLAALGEDDPSTALPESSFSLPRAPPGYPQPLTAGPPGQRSSAAAVNKTNRYIESLWTNDAGASAYNHTGGTEATSPWFNNYNTDQVPYPQYSTTAQREFGDQINSRNPTQPVDTLPISAIAKYYPKGLPANMSGAFTPLPPKVRESMDRGESQLGLEDWKSKAQKHEEKQKKLDDWFYQGQRRFTAMKAEDYIGEFQEHHNHDLEQRRGPNLYGPIGPPPKKVFGPVNNTPISMDQMKKMPTSEASGKLVDAAFGSLLGYAEKGSASRNKLSQFAPSPAWQIDSSEKGNVSFFGEDWGPPPKRYGRDPRFQPEFHGPSTTHWE